MHNHLLMKMAFQQSQTAALNGQAQESQATAQKIAVETQLAPQELQIDQIKAVTANLKAGDQEDKEFERRLKIAEVAFKEKELTDKAGGATRRANDTNRNQQIPEPNQRSVQRPNRPIGEARNQARGPRGPNVGSAPEGAL